ncbi:GNAT family N-acetyltransferase [Rhodocytophaga rosea]|uniref:GNAT family N-acetyltransferase n=1 Tax=Rhodocytophaga rosea TaxID=2704465 RepID=A0A6C0GHB9_9BACT|nr:GNAT family N-acetyltransferase [Rhodocytophaga rosea]QHT67092.1 GNAT family N-acetyltransferase [Rhodocytophaga rosea]
MTHAELNTDIAKAHSSDFQEITEVWEASVRATHHFLQEKDIQYFKPLILNEYLWHVYLFCIRNEKQQITGFLGIAGNKIEMLFIHPEAMGKGIGKKLITYAIQHLQATEVDVNEQNEQALGFYLHTGFKVVNRSETDGLGKPFPILHLALANSTIIS